MKSYIIKQAGGLNTNLYAESIEDLERAAIRFNELKAGGNTRIFVKTDIVTNTRNTCKVEKDVKYMIYINNQKMTITTRRIR